MTHNGLEPGDAGYEETHGGGGDGKPLTAYQSQQIELARRRLTNQESDQGSLTKVSDGFYLDQNSRQYYTYGEIPDPNFGPPQYGLRPATPDEVVYFLQEEQRASAPRAPQTSAGAWANIELARQRLGLDTQKLELEYEKADSDMRQAQADRDYTTMKDVTARYDKLEQAKATLASQERQLQQQEQSDERQRQFTSGEAEKGRQYQGAQSSADRAARAGEFAANQRQQQEELAFSRQQASQGFERQRTQDRLAAAQQYSQLVSQVDPAAMPAFYEAGGGNIGNALASGATGLSTNALAPAAQTLQAIEGLNAQGNPYAGGFSRPQAAVNNDPYYGVPANQRMYADPRNQNNYVNANELGQISAGQTPPTAPPVVNGVAQVPSQQAPAQQAAPQQTAMERWVEQGGQAFARGGVTQADQFIVGDPQVPGQVNPELVQVYDPAGANNAYSRVTPVQGFGRGTAPVPQYAFGTGLTSGEQPPSNVRQAGQQGANPFGDFNTGSTGYAPAAQQMPTDPTLQPFIEKVRQARMAVDVTPPIAGGYMNVGFNRLAPSLQSRYYAGLQSRYGIGQQDSMAEQRRYALSGFNRPGAVGY